MTIHYKHSDNILYAVLLSPTVQYITHTVITLYAVLLSPTVQFLRDLNFKYCIFAVLDFMIWPYYIAHTLGLEYSNDYCY